MTPASPENITTIRNAINNLFLTFNLLIIRSPPRFHALLKPLIYVSYHTLIQYKLHAWFIDSL